MAVIIIIGIVAFIGCLWFAYILASAQNSAIGECFKIKKLHNDVLFGRHLPSDLTDSELLALKRPLFTCVGFGGRGPDYTPSFEVYDMVRSEINSRRAARV